jgi:Tol biopolymer transport system component
VPEHFGVPDGTEVLHVYDMASGVVSAVRGSEGLYTCRWSPDGRYLAGLTIDLTPAQMMLKIYDRTHDSWRALTDAHHVNDPNWSSDSQFIYYDTEGDHHALRGVRVTDGRVEELRSLADYPVARHWSGLAPDNSPLLLHDLGTVGIYAFKLRR